MITDKSDLFDKNFEKHHNKYMKRLILCLVLMLLGISAHPSFTDASFAETKSVIINTCYTYLYKTTDFLEHYEFKITENEIISCIEEDENFYKVSYSYNQESYMGYVSGEVASIYTPPQQSLLVYNGRISRKTNVYKVTEDETLDGIVLEAGHEIYLYEGFDSKNTYTNIKFNYNGNVLTGRILTKDLSPNGINKAVIISLSIIVALVSVVLILMGLSKKKWHNPLKKRKK